jgi:glycosyltransferase involved in cell wall biosynthesis
MIITIITDAWHPQVNGVVNTYNNIKNILEKDHINVNIIHAYIPTIKTYSLPFYKEIEIAINPWRILRTLDLLISYNHRIHIATEGPLGLFARIYLSTKKYPFTTCYHTKFPEFIKDQLNIPTWITYPFFKWFHSKSTTLMVPTHQIKKELEDKHFKNVKVWTRGVNNTTFNPERRTTDNEDYIICVSRASKEKNLDDFCKLQYKRKILVGDGPYLEELKQKYKDVEFTGTKKGTELATLIANSKAFIFPSLNDTFGIVLLESIACGTPVISYHTSGSREVIKQYQNGIITNDLQLSLQYVDRISRETTYESSKEWTWERSAENFLSLINK